MISAEDIEAFKPEEPDLKWSDFFDVRSGVLIHKERDDCPNWVWNARYAGKPAGTIRSDGYIRVKVVVGTGQTSMPHDEFRAADTMMREAGVEVLRA